VLLTIRLSRSPSRHFIEHSQHLSRTVSLSFILMLLPSRSNIVTIHVVIVVGIMVNDKLHGEMPCVIIFYCRNDGLHKFQENQKIPEVMTS